MEARGKGIARDLIQFLLANPDKNAYVGLSAKPISRIKSHIADKDKVFESAYVVAQSIYTETMVLEKVVIQEVADVMPERLINRAAGGACADLGGRPCWLYVLIDNEGQSPIGRQNFDYSCLSSARMSQTRELLQAAGIAVKRSILTPTTTAVLRWIYGRVAIKVIKEGKFKCTKCTQGFTQQRYLNEHFKMHVTKPRFACDKCDVTYSRIDKLRTHKIEKHNGVKIVKMKKCPGCKTNIKTSSLLAHLRETHKELLKACPQYAVLYTAEGLKDHIRFVHVQG